MPNPKLMYLKHPYPYSAYLEYKAITALYFDGDGAALLNLYPELDNAMRFKRPIPLDVETLEHEIGKGITTLPEFYISLERMLSDQSKPIAGDAPVPVFNNHSDLPTRYIEWLAIFQLVFKGDREAMRLAYNDGYADVGLGLADSFHKATKKVSQHPRDKSKRDLLSLKGSVFTKGQTFDAFMVEMRKRRRRITVKDKKVAGQTMAREAYQRQELGPAYVDDKPLYGAVKALATPDLAERHLSDAHIDELILTLDGVAELSDEQRVSLRENTLRPRLDKFNAQGLVEAAIVAHAEQMATGGKALAFLWLKLKHTYLKDDMIVMSQDQIAKFAGISKAHAGPAMKVLLKLGAIEQISKARRNSFDATAAKYRRLV
jgi:hypothetical protein